MCIWLESFICFAFRCLGLVCLTLRCLVLHYPANSIHNFCFYWSFDLFTLPINNNNNSFNKCRSSVEDWQLNKFMECAFGRSARQNIQMALVVPLVKKHFADEKQSEAKKNVKIKQISAIAWSIHIIYYIFITETLYTSPFARAHRFRVGLSLSLCLCESLNIYVCFVLNFFFSLMNLIWWQYLFSAYS